MLAWVEETVRTSSQKSWLWRHCRRRAIYWLLRSPSQTCHAKPKTQINRRRTLPASFPLVGCLPQAAWPERLLSESQDAVALQPDWGVALYLWLIVLVISVRQSTVAAISWASLPGAGYGQFEHKADSLIAKFKEAGGTMGDVWAELPRLSPLWLSASSSACHGLLIITVITPLPTKPNPRQNAEELKLANSNYWHADASAWCCCARCKIHEGVSWC